MANSPHVVVFFVTDSTGTPVTGGAGGMSFERYSDDTGSALSAPAITEIGNGLYKFTPTFPASPARGTVYVLNTGTNRVPQRYWAYLRPEDWSGDDVPPVLKKVLTNRSKIFSSGPEANRLVVYDDDGTTVLFRFDLKDQLGVASPINPFEKLPA